MSLEQKVSAKQIVRDTGMSDRPGFYSGRGAVTCDLNSKYLEKIYDGIKNSYGEEAAQNYTQMVAEMPKLSATDFLLTLYLLEQNSWKWDKNLLGDGKGIEIEKDKDGTYFLDQGLATVAGMMFGDNNRDETSQIRREFLQKRGLYDHPDLKKNPYEYEFSGEIIRFRKY